MIEWRPLIEPKIPGALDSGPATWYGWTGDPNTDAPDYAVSRVTLGNYEIDDCVTRFLLSQRATTPGSIKNMEFNSLEAAKNYAQKLETVKN